MAWIKILSAAYWVLIPRKDRSLTIAAPTGAACVATV